MGLMILFQTSQNDVFEWPCKGNTFDDKNQVYLIMSDKVNICHCETDFKKGSLK